MHLVTSISPYQNCKRARAQNFGEHEILVKVNEISLMNFINFASLLQRFSKLMKQSYHSLSLPHHIDLILIDIYTKWSKN